MKQDRLDISDETFLENFYLLFDLQSMVMLISGNCARGSLELKLQKQLNSWSIFKTKNHWVRLCSVESLRLPANVSSLMHFAEDLVSQ